MPITGVLWQEVLADVAGLVVGPRVQRMVIWYVGWNSAV